MRGTFSADDLLVAVKSEVASDREGDRISGAGGDGDRRDGGTSPASSGGAALYTRCRTGEHHHHLVCTGCGRVEETECQLDDMVGRALTTSGFVVTGHELNMFGLCSDCA